MSQSPSWVLALILVGGACGAPVAPPVEQRAPNAPVWVASPPPVWRQRTRRCPPPALVSLDLQENQDEIVLIFTAVQGEEQALREQVRLMADRINRGGSLEPLPGGQQTETAPPAAAQQLQALATVEPIEGGARLTLTAIDPAQEERLRDRVRRYAVDAARCPSPGS